jgi:hypothetical protein
MNNYTKNTKKKNHPIARHRILVFKEEIRTVHARRRSINPLFLKAHDYETFRIIPLQSN